MSMMVGRSNYPFELEARWMLGANQQLKLTGLAIPLLRFEVAIPGPAT